jgi:DNA-binding transcriptional LysR family regulator
VIRASGSLADIPAFQWFGGLGGTVALLSQSPLAQLEACARGQGVALLPIRIADQDSRLVRLDLPTCSAGQVWLAADANEASHPRIAGFLRWARRRFAARRESAPLESA